MVHILLTLFQGQQVIAVNNMSTARIDICDYEDCCIDRYGIDRTMPAIMNGRMSDCEWELFCNQVDQHIVPLNQYPYLLCGFLFAVMIGLTTTALIARDVVLPIVYFFLVSGLLVLLCYLSHLATDAFRKVSQVCEATSRDIPSVSLSFREDRSGNGDSVKYDRYIEVSFKDAYISNSAQTVSPMDVVAVPMYDLEAGDPNSTSRGTNKTLADIPVMPPAK
jgi:hypothetical protein